MSRTHKFQSRTNAPRFPSGQIASGAPVELVAPPPPPRPPPRPPRPPVGAVSPEIRAPAHSVAAAGQASRFFVMGSMTTISDPLAVELRYQNRQSAMHTGAT